MEKIRVDTSIENFNAINEIKHIEKILCSLAEKYPRARSRKGEILSGIHYNINKIKRLAELYRVKSKIPARIKKLLSMDDEPLLNALNTREKRRIRAVKSRGKKKSQG